MPPVRLVPHLGDVVANFAHFGIKTRSPVLDILDGQIRDPFQTVAFLRPERHHDFGVVRSPQSGETAPSSCTASPW